MVHEEGLENAWARHRRNHLALKAGLEAMGLDFSSTRMSACRS
jgi:alanine-glyoxylate transaminase/serine-glyoxylate transaminase/serine-pyruvate transaminase